MKSFCSCTDECDARYFSDMQMMYLNAKKLNKTSFSRHPQLKMKITDFENRRSFKSIWLNSQFREEVKHNHTH